MIVLKVPQSVGFPSTKFGQILVKRDNHYVPDSYVKRWADDVGKVWAYRVLVPHANERMWKPHSPKSIGYQKHLYTRMATSGESDDIENWFETDFETPASSAFRRVMAEEVMRAEDWRLLVRFLAAQDVRTPASLVERLRQWEEVLPKLVEASLMESVRKLKKAKRTGMQIPPVNSAEDLDFFPSRTFIRPVEKEKEVTLQVELTAGRGLWLWSLKRALTSTLNALHTHRWSILYSPPGIEWLTSDNPVVRLNSRTPQDFDFKGGWSSRGTFIFMPLSPKHLLYTIVGSAPLTERTASLFFAAQIQRYTIEHAHRYVFGRSADRQVEFWRPRTVNSQAFHAEAEQWRNWHREQSDAELEILQSRAG